MCTESFLTLLSDLVCINAFYLKTMLWRRRVQCDPYLLIGHWKLRDQAGQTLTLPPTTPPSPQLLSTTPSCKTNPDLRMMSITEGDENAMTTIHWTCTLLKAGHMLPCWIFPRAPWGRDNHHSILGGVRDSSKAAHPVSSGTATTTATTTVAMTVAMTMALWLQCWPRAKLSAQHAARTICWVRTATPRNRFSSHPIFKPGSWDLQETKGLAQGQLLACPPHTPRPPTPLPPTAPPNTSSYYPIPSKGKIVMGARQRTFHNADALEIRFIGNLAQDHSQSSPPHSPLTVSHIFPVG